MASIFKQRYTAYLENGKVVTKKSKNWYFDYTDADGVRQRVKGLTDKAATLRMAADYERNVEKIKNGEIDRYAEHRNKPLEEHLRDFKLSLLSSGISEKQVNLVYGRTRRLIEGCGFIFMKDISALAVQSFCADLRRKGISKRTSNFYLQAIQRFSEWLVINRRTPENIIGHIKGENPKTDIRRSRRALTEGEITKLLKATRQAKKYCNMEGNVREKLYILAMNTGLRASELDSLRWNSFNFDDKNPSIKVTAAYSKHRREDILPLRQDIAEMFRDWQKTRGDKGNDKVFPKIDSHRTANMIERDLIRAGIPYQDEEGRYADFHALRYTFITNMVKSGASPKVCQALARHCSIALTMDVYTYLKLFDLKSALEKLPNFLESEECESQEESTNYLKTGTDDNPIETG